MADKPVTLVVSDLHVGGGKKDLGDDHVYQDNQFRRFIEMAGNSDDGRAGRLELFINGDFLEFAQVRPDVYTLDSAKYWCSEAESVAKLDDILTGHADIFAALKKFGGQGNRVTLAAGNHDVDLYWADVQKKIRDAAGDINFETGKDVCERYGGRLQIGHGHMIDPANSFKNWGDPFLLRTQWGGPDELRLEMCPGTLFMVKFVNGLEKDYPFSDNLKPLKALARLLFKEQIWGFVAAAWSFFTFVDEHPGKALGVNDKNLIGSATVGRRIVEELALNPEFREHVVQAYQQFIDPAATADEIAKRLSTEQAVTEFMNQLMVQGAGPEMWKKVFDVPGAPTLSATGQSKGDTLTIIKAGMAQDKEDLREEAELRLAAPGVEVVVFGHTHQPDEWRGVGGGSDGGYFNPGSWTRYVDITDMPQLTLKDLEHEEDFPYQLNYVRIEPTASGSLRADKVCFEQARGARFSP